MNTILFCTLLTPLLIFLLSQILTTAGILLKLTTLEFYGRSTASFLALVVCATYGTLASAALNIAGKGGLGQWTTARAFKWTCWYWIGVWFDINDPEDALGQRGRDGGGGVRPAVYVGNHQTELDVLMLGHVFPKYTSVTAKRSLKFVPFLGWFMAMSKTVFIERSSRTQAFAAFDNAAKQMHSTRQSVYIFPEGTRSYYDHADMLAFKKGAFHLAIQAQVPIVPIVVANYSNILNIKKKIFRAGRIPIKVIPPIETKGKTKEDLPALLEEVRDKMMAALKELTNHAREEGIAVKKEESVGEQKSVNGMAKSSGVDVGLNAAAARS